MELNEIKKQGKWTEISDTLNENFAKVNAETQRIELASRKNKGYYATYDELTNIVPQGDMGDIAFIGTNYPYRIYKWDGTAWIDTFETGGEQNVNLANYYTRDDIKTLLSTKQDKLVSEINIKTIDGESILGKGDVSLKPIREQIEKNTKDIDVNTDRLNIEGTQVMTVDEMINFNPIANEGGSYLVGYLDKSSRYVVTKEVGGIPVNVGILEILSDSSQHVYTQVFTTHFVLDDSGNLDLGAHSDTKLVTYFRSYSIDSPLIDSGTWTKWKDISHCSDIQESIAENKRDMSESNFSFFIDGNNDEIVRHKLAGLKQGRKYRLIIKNNDYRSDNTPQGVYIFQIYKYTGSVGTIVVGVGKGNTVNNYYDFEIDNSDYFGCFIRADIGQRVYMYVVDITEPCNAVWFGGSTLPNIDTATHTITFPSDGAFMVNNKLSLPINSGTPIDYYTPSSSSAVLVYNITTRTISARAFSEQAIDGDVVFGGIKTLYGKPEQFLNATLPFDFTINGKSARDIAIDAKDIAIDAKDIAIDAKDKMTNGLFGFSFTGIGMGGDENGIIRYNFNTIKKGRKYRIVIVNNDYATSEITTGYGIFQIYKYTGTEGTIVTNVAKGQSVNNYYDFVADDLTADYYGVFVRANTGVVVMMYMMDITDIDISLPLFFQNTGENKYYNGEDISLRHPITITTRNYTDGTGGYTQGLAYYNGYFVRCFNNLSKISIFNASTLALESEFEPSLGLTVHCNTVSFGAKYDENDIFPLLYCPSEAASERKIYVIRINNTMDGVTLIQTISLPSINEMPIYWPNGAIDIEGGHIVVSGYTDGSHNAYGAIVYPSSKIGVFIFNIPQIETQTTLSSADILDSFYIPAITTTQGFQVCNNRIYQIFGLPSQQLDPDIRLGVIDLGQKRIVNVINLTGYGITTEPEGLAIKDDSIFIDFINHFKEITF